MKKDYLLHFIFLFLFMILLNKTKISREPDPKKLKDFDFAHKLLYEVQYGVIYKEMAVDSTTIPNHLLKCKTNWE